MLEDAAGTSRSGAMLRELYVIILRFCVPSNPQQLFEDHWMDWKDDFQVKAGWRDVVNLTEVQIHQLRVRVLLDLEQRLQSFEVTLKDCQLPQLTQEDVAMVEQLDAVLSLPATIREELDFDVEEMRALARFYSLFFCCCKNDHHIHLPSFLLLFNTI